MLAKGRASVLSAMFVALAVGCQRGAPSPSPSAEDASKERAELTSQAKALGVAMLIAVGDENDVFPPPARFAPVVAPYLKASEKGALARFVATFPGGASSAIVSRRSTEIGYLKGRTGRAVVYADGSAEWIGGSS